MTKYLRLGSIRELGIGPSAHLAFPNQGPTLLSKVRRGDEDGWNQFYELYGKLEQAILNEAQKLAKEKVRMQDYQAYDLFELQELGAREVAISLGISVATVRVRAFRVRRAINQEVRRIIKMLEQPNRFA